MKLLELEQLNIDFFFPVSPFLCHKKDVKLQSELTDNCKKCNHHIINNLFIIPS